MKKQLWWGVGITLIVLAAVGGVARFNAVKPLPSAQPVISGGVLSRIAVLEPSVTVAAAPIKPTVAFVGPRGGLPADAPQDYGFWSLAMPVPGVLSRSGQPLISGFKWLKDNGWHGVIDLRVDGERGEVGDDAKLPGFKALGLNYLPMPIIDGHAPTDAQAEQFLSFVQNPQNQPVHIHCRGGIGRAGVMVALYRYQVQGWEVDQAVAESRLFQGGISDVQLKWLQNWAAEYPH